MCPILEYLEDRWVPSTVHFSIDPQQDAHSISRFIYGVNQNLDGAYANLTFTRAGGNRWTAYNWENNASNAGSDYIFQNDDYLGGGNTPGGAVSPLLQNASDHNAGALITVPINGYVAADTNGGGDVHNSGANYLQARFKQELARKGTPFTLTPNPNDQFVYEDEFVNWVKTNYPYALTDPNRPIFFSLDNEPDLWAETHSEVHPNAVTYAELVQKSIAYASAIKDVMPNTEVFGPVNYGWYGFTALQGAPDANGRDFQDFYLQQMRQAETTYGHRLIDALDVHWYPEATGGGVRITTEDSSPAVLAARLQAPRSLWDATYTESSWITQYSTLGPINLLPRLQDKINTYYPGTKLAITEYNYGGGGDISGGIAEADVLGIFGRDGVFAANEFPLAANEAFIAGAFQMFRNFDGNKGTFGDTSILANTDDVPDSSVYASYDSANPNVMTLVVLNKTSQPLASVLQLNNIAKGATADIYQLTSASANPHYAGHTTIADPANFSYTMPAYSVSTIRIVLPGGTNSAPTVASPASAADSPVTGTSMSLSVLGADDSGEGNLTYTWSTLGTPPAPVSFSSNANNAAKDTVATFTRAGNYSFLVRISNGSLDTTSQVDVTVNQTPTSIFVSPHGAKVRTGANKQFSAVEMDQFSQPMSSAPSFSWSILSGAGSITQGGLYTAPGVAGSATVQAAADNFSGSANLTILTLPAAPSNLVATGVSSSQINLVWTDHANNETGFVIERSTDGKKFVEIGTVKANVTHYSAKGLLRLKTYYFRVRAVNSVGDSDWSHVASARTRH